MNFSVYLLLLETISLTIFIGYPSIAFAKHIGLMDIPHRSAHKIHKSPTPLVGGLILLIVFLFLRFTPLINNTFLDIFPAVLIILFFGLLDDWKGLSAFPKFFGQIVACGLLIYHGHQVHLVGYFTFFENLKFLEQWMNIAITFLWLIGITNAFNLIDSMDGLVAGLAGIAFGFFAIAAFASQQPELTGLSVMMVGICIGLYFFNGYPARMFLGDGGAQTLGFLLAVIGMKYDPLDYNQLSSWFVPILILFLPIFDTTLVVLSRLRRHTPIYKGHLDHTYHRLASYGLPVTHAIGLIHFSAFILGNIAFIALDLSPLYANGIFFSCLFIGALIILWMDWKWQESPLEKL